MPGQSRLFLDFCAGALRAFLPLDEISQAPPPRPAHWPELVHLLAEQNRSPTAEDSLAALAQGAGAVLTGQQVGLFGGPLYSPFKAATAIARARKSTAAGHPHVAIFWLASEDHDFAEVDHVTFPAGRELAHAHLRKGSRIRNARRPHRLRRIRSRPSSNAPPSSSGRPKPSDALVAAYKPGRTFAQAFADSIPDSSPRRAFSSSTPPAATSIASARPSSAPPSSAPTSSTPHSLERGQALEAAGYHAQVAVARNPACYSSSTPGPAHASRFAPRAHARRARRPLARRRADLLHIRSPRHPRRRARAHLSLGASSPRLSGLSAFDSAIRSAARRDRLLRAVRRSLRAHPRPPNACHRAPSPPRSSSRPSPSFSAATSSPSSRSSPSQNASARAAPRRPLHAHRRPSKSWPPQATPSTPSSPPSSNGCNRRTRAWANRRHRRRQNALPDEPPAHARRQLPAPAREPRSPATPTPSSTRFIPAAFCRSASTAGRTTSPATAPSWPKHSASRPPASAPATPPSGCERSRVTPPLRACRANRRAEIFLKIALI
jgi:hypothetical protein